MSSISISFDPSHNPEMPTMVLMKKSGEMFGQLDSKSVVLKDQLVNASEITFVVKKYVDGEITPLWDKITNFKLVYCVEWNTVFEIKVDVDETNETTKTVYGTELAQSELSQIMLFNNEINTETDIARDDYANPTVLYKPNTPSESLLHRMLEKAPHYTILHVDDSIKNIQRTFSFDNVSLYDAFNQVAEEIDCVFIYNSRLDSNGDIIRGISVYDLETVCNDCGHRGDYIDNCPKCDSTNLTYGYGEDTTIFITADKLASDIQLSTDVGAVKNCFKLKAGDDLMTATVRNCSLDGSGYIWYISNKLKEDMSDELVEKLDNYDAFYSYYQNSYNPFSINTSGLNSTDAAKVHSELASNSSLITSYNNLINKYNTYTSDYHIISSSIIGYSELMKIYYDTISFYYYLNDSLMPTVTMSETNAQTEANKLNNQNLKNTAVQNLSSTTSVATVSSAILAMAKVLVDTNYQVKIVDEESTFTYSQSQSKWRGKFVVTNYSDDSDTYTTAFQTIDISSDYATFIKQKVEAALAKTKTDTIASINDLFKLSDTKFKNELKRYSLQRLKAFHDACQGCLDILQQQGIANDRNEDNDEPTSMYSTIYLPYYNKLGFIQSEMDVRQSELDIIQGKFDENGGVLKQGVQTVLQKEIDTIQSNLNLQEYLGNNLWLELLTYRREDIYSNDNYISDGLDNTELFDKATEFIQTAKTEIKKSATLQHTITATLKNLLVMKEFSSIVNYFKVGNWLRIQIDDVIYKLRLVDYEIDFDNLENINITFSDVTVDNSGTSSIKDVLSQASNMTTTYNTVTRQAKKGSEGANVLDNWVDNGLMTTKTKIVDSADNQDIVWDKHGLLCREYDSVTGTYGDKQLKLINKGLYLTDNNWRTAKAGIGNFVFFNPSANNGEGEYQEAYGVIADTIVGNIILGKSVGIYNTKNSLTMDEDGFVLTTNGTNNNETQSVFTIRRKTVSNGVKSFKDMFYIDSNGYVTINGGVKIDIDGESGNSTMVEMVDGKITTHITDGLADGGLIESSISQTAGEIRSEVNSTYETKTDATTKKINLESSISQTAAQIRSTVSSAVSKYDTTGYTITISGYGAPTTSPNSFAASSYNGKYYLDQNNGKLYLSNGSSWSNPTTLKLITTNLQTQISQNATDITSKVSSGDVHTIIQQTPEDVRIAWNGISNYISFENAAIKIKNSSNNLLMQLNNSGMNLYDGSSTLLSRLNSNGISLYESDGNSGSRLTMRMNRGGANYYNEGNYTGKIGTNKMVGDATIRGLTFNLETVADGDTARYMSWAYRDNSSDTAYTIKMAYYTNDFNYTNSSNVQQSWKKGFHFADNVYFRYDAHIGDNGYIGDYNDGIIFENTVDGSTNSFLRITGGRGATVKLDKDVEVGADMGKLSSSIDFYMNNHKIYDSAITSSSDARLKKNISSSSEKALSLLEKIDVSQFDWIETNEHIAAGFIAQQLQDVIPQAVLENPETTRLSIRTDILIPYIVKAIQELTDCIGTDNKYKNALQAIGVTTSKIKKKWEDKTSLSDKNKFISKTKIEPPIIEKPSEKEKRNKKIILPG